MGIEWKPELAIGVPEVDAQHEELFRRAEAMLEASKQARGREGVRASVAFLQSYVASHFAAEEELQRRTGFPDCAAHRELHKRFADDVALMVARLEREGASVGLVLEVNRAVVTWLVTHIRGPDQDIGRYLKARS